MDLSPDLIAIIAKGKAEFINESGVAMLGAKSAEEILGRDIVEFVVPEQRANVAELVEKVIAGKRVPLGERTVLRVDGNMLPVEAAAIPFQHQGSTAALVIVRDISGRTAAEEDYRRTVSLLQSTLESTADGILVVDAAGRVVLWNQQFVEMWRVEGNLASRPASEVMESVLGELAEPELFVAPIRRLYDDPEADSFDVVHFRDGRTFERLSRAQRLDGRPVGRVWSFRDVTDRVRAEEVIRKKDAILEAVSIAAEHFLLVSDWRERIDEVLMHLGRAASASRVYVFERVGPVADFVFSQTHEWTAEGISAQIANPALQNLPLARDFPRWVDLLSRGKIVDGRVRDFPTSERRLLEPQEIRSVAVVPVFVGSDLWGFIGFDDCLEERQWASTETDALRTAAETLAAAISRQHSEAALRISEARWRQLFERNLAGVFRTSLRGEILDCNEACARIFGYASIEDFIEHSADDVYFDDLEREEMIRALVERGSLTNLEACYRRKDGSPVWVMESVSLLRGAGEEPDVMEGTLIDISDRKRAEEKQRESEERYRMMAEYSTDMISRQTPDGMYLYVSPASKPLLGYEPGELVGKDDTELVHPEDLDSVRAAKEMIRTEQRPKTFTCRIRRKSGDWVWFESTSRALRHPESGEVQEIISVSRDITQRKLDEEKIEHQAYHDSLTGLPNRLLFRDRLTVALRHTRRLGTRVAVMFLDLDKFKDINDTFGHSVGDHFLQEVATCLKGALREQDTVARMGGDEFTVLLSDLRDDHHAAAIAQKLLETISRPIFVDNHELHATTSIGVALFPADGEDAETLLKNADNAMYRAKELGRNNFQLCTPSLNVRTLERLSIERSLRRGIERNEFAVFYQPRFDVESGEILGNEALVRWNHPEKGLLEPEYFLGVAEDARIIHAIGESVLRTACMQTSKWQKAGWSELRIAVNLSARQFHQRGLVPSIAAILAETGLPPRFLEVEITEETAMQNPEWTVSSLNQLRELGVRIAIDDFGTGQSSLQFLKRFPLDAVKVNQIFLREIHSPVGAAMVGAICMIARGLQLEVIAEGVETDEQREFLRAERCRQMQGYLFSRPVPAADLENLLRRKGSRPGN
ncbi:MAG: EAL domain-containing protein [Thermoanaerobaculia bacterium]